MLTYRLHHGLGDCLIAAASLQSLGRPVNYDTNPAIQELFKYHPDVKYVRDSPPHTYEFKWVSQIKSTNLYALHTMQRFSSQIGFYLDPTKVFDIYGPNGKIVSTPQERTVCINQYSAERNRRYIPDEYMDVILGEIEKMGYTPVFIGANKNRTIVSISEMTKHLTNCKLFIGPISFCYHYASCLRTQCLLFTSYMPAHKFSHFFNTVHIDPVNSPCRFTCEELHNKCEMSCKHTYDIEEIKWKLRNALR